VKSPVSAWYEAGGYRVHARVGGRPDGPPIVLVHGIAVSSRYMVPLARELGSWAHVYAPDLPGFGRSAKPPRALGVSALAGALEAWLDAAELERPALVANSFGCQVAVELAASRPERISHLVLVGPTIDLYARRRRVQVARWLRTALVERPPLHFVVARDALAAGVVRSWQTFGHALADPVELKLPGITVPALVVRGERDPLASQAWSEEVARLLPNGQLVVIPGAGHALNWSRPRELGRLVRELL